MCDSFIISYLTSKDASQIARGISIVEGKLSESNQFQPEDAVQIFPLLIPLLMHMHYKVRKNAFYLFLSILNRFSDYLDSTCDSVPNCLASLICVDEEISECAHQALEFIFDLDDPKYWWPYCEKVLFNSKSNPQRIKVMFIIYSHFDEIPILPIIKLLDDPILTIQKMAYSMLQFNDQEAIQTKLEKYRALLGIESNPYELDLNQRQLERYLQMQESIRAQKSQKNPAKTVRRNRRSRASENLLETRRQAAEQTIQDEMYAQGEKGMQSANDHKVHSRFVSKMETTSPIGKHTKGSYPSYDNYQLSPNLTLNPQFNLDPNPNLIQTPNYNDQNGMDNQDFMYEDYYDSNQQNFNNNSSNRKNNQQFQSYNQSPARNGYGNNGNYNNFDNGNARSRNSQSPYNQNRSSQQMGRPNASPANENQDRRNLSSSPMNSQQRMNNNNNGNNSNNNLFNRSNNNGSNQFNRSNNNSVLSNRSNNNLNNNYGNNPNNNGLFNRPNNANNSPMNNGMFNRQSNNANQNNNSMFNRSYNQGQNNDGLFNRSNNNFSNSLNNQGNRNGNMNNRFNDNQGNRNNFGNNNMNNRFNDNQSNRSNGINMNNRFADNQSNRSNSNMNGMNNRFNDNQNNRGQNMMNNRFNNNPNNRNNNNMNFMGNQFNDGQNFRNSNMNGMNNRFNGNQNNRGNMNGMDGRYNDNPNFRGNNNNMNNMNNRFNDNPNNNNNYNYNGDQNMDARSADGNAFDQMYPMNQDSTALFDKDSIYDGILQQLGNTINPNDSSNLRTRRSGGTGDASQTIGNGSPTKSGDPLPFELVDLKDKNWEYRKDYLDKIHKTLSSNKKHYDYRHDYLMDCVMDAAKPPNKRVAIALSKVITDVILEEPGVIEPFLDEITNFMVQSVSQFNSIYQVPSSPKATKSANASGRSSSMNTPRATSKLDNRSATSNIGNSPKLSTKSGKSTTKETKKSKNDDDDQQDAESSKKSTTSKSATKEIENSKNEEDQASSKMSTTSKSATPSKNSKIFDIPTSPSKTSRVVLRSKTPNSAKSTTSTKKNQTKSNSKAIEVTNRLSPCVTNETSYDVSAFDELIDAIILEVNPAKLINSMLDYPNRTTAHVELLIQKLYRRRPNLTLCMNDLEKLLTFLALDAYPLALKLGTIGGVKAQPAYLDAVIFILHKTSKNQPKIYSTIISLQSHAGMIEILSKFLPQQEEENFEQQDISSKTGNSQNNYNYNYSNSNYNSRNVDQNELDYNSPPMFIVLRELKKNDDCSIDLVADSLDNVSFNSPKHLLKIFLRFLALLSRLSEKKINDNEDNLRRICFSHFNSTDLLSILSLRNVEPEILVGLSKYIWYAPKEIFNGANGYYENMYRLFTKSTGPARNAIIVISSAIQKATKKSILDLPNIAEPHQKVIEKLLSQYENQDKA